MELNAVLRRVRALVAKAEDSGVTPQESAAYSAMADQLMLKYAIDMAAIRAAAPAQERDKPDVMEVMLVSLDADISGYVAAMLSMIAKYSRCMNRNYTGYSEGQWQSKVYGYQHDLKFFEILYTTIRLHMLNALVPRVEPAESLEENCYRLHEAGYNWLEIAEMYGWRKQDQAYSDIKVPYKNKQTGTIEPSTMVGSRYKRAYNRQCKKLGQATVRINASSSKTYRQSAASGYITRLAQRIRAIEGQRGTGSELVLRGSQDDLAAFFREQNPDLFEEVETYDDGKPGRVRKFRAAPFDHRAYQVGVRHADTADLNPSGGKFGHARSIAGER